MAASLNRRSRDDKRDEEDEPPPDLLAECDSDETIEAVRDALRTRHDVVPIESDERRFYRLREARPDLVFNIAERLFGPNRESHIPSLCEILGIPYTGSDPLTLSLCLDKSRAKEILSYHKIPNPEFWIVEPGAARPRGHQAAGDRQAALRRIEQRHQGQLGRRRRAELRRPRPGSHVALQAAGHRRALSHRPRIHGRRPGQLPASRNPADRRDRPRPASRGAGPIYSYEAKWIWDTPEKPLEIFKCPARIPAELEVAHRRHRRPRPAGSCGSGTGAASTSAWTTGRAEHPGSQPAARDPAQARGQFLPAQSGPDGRLFLHGAHPASRRRGLRPLWTCGRCRKPRRQKTADKKRRRSCDIRIGKMKDKNILVGIAYNAYDPLTGRNGERASEESVEQTAKEVLTAVTELGYTAFIIPLQKSFMSFLHRLKDAQGRRPHQPLRRRSSGIPSSRPTSPPRSSSSASPSPATIPGPWPSA